MFRYILLVVWVLSSTVCARLIWQERLPCPRDAGDRCREMGCSAWNGCTYQVDDIKVRIIYMVGSHLNLYCDNVVRQLPERLGGMSALPHPTDPVRLSYVLVWGCAPPVGRYADLLDALNVIVTNKLLVRKIPSVSSASPLRSDHFTGLTTVRTLELESAESRYHQIPVDAFATFPTLQVLSLSGIEPPITLELWPRSLTLKNSTKEVYAPVSRTLHDLSVSLTESDKSSITVDLQGTPALLTLYLDSYNSRLRSARLPDTLIKLNVRFWGETRPDPWRNCDNLQELRIEVSSAASKQIELPEYWVSQCRALTTLSLYIVKLAKLPATLLRDTESLSSLRLSSCDITELPPDLFTDSHNLVSLDLSQNKLSTLPSEVFATLTALRVLDLSDNQLTVSESTVAALQPLHTLRELMLDYNNELSDLCEHTSEGTSASSLHHMTKLTRLVLRHTSVSRVCRDWREDMPLLRELDLSYTDLVLKYEDFTQTRHTNDSKYLKVIMKVGGNVLRFNYSREDYLRSQSDPVADGNDVVVEMEQLGRVMCDCSAYWIALAYRNSPRYMRWSAPRCYGDLYTLRTIPLDKLKCT